MAAGSEIALTYRLSWGWDVPDLSGLLKVERTLSGAGDSGRRRFVDRLSPARAQTGASAVQLVAQANPGSMHDAEISENPEIKGLAAQLRPRPRGRGRGRDADGAAVRRTPDRRDMGLPMEQLTAHAAAGATARRAAAARSAPRDARAELCAATSRTPPARARARVRLARAGLFAASLLLTVLLVHQMWLVLSVGELTGVERVMLGLFVINIAWIVVRRAVAADGLLPRRRPPPAGAGRAADSAPRS